jgi:hypothetical protein
MVTSTILAFSLNATSRRLGLKRGDGAMEGAGTGGIASPLVTV